jgi:methyl-CpG-binding domain protein 4|tara:strand:+ start:89 stop:544 length:456 start_codon:yes stop_codon:yes gene_type:complete
MSDWIPPKSPHGLIQEDLWPNQWKILVSCLLLNLTTRKQVDKVIGTLFQRYPAPEDLAAATEEDLHDMLRTLGMWKKRAKTLIRFSKEFLLGDWITANDLYGCGKYADDAWHIFCVGDWESIEPSDHALNDYHNFLKEKHGPSKSAKACAA